MASENNVLRIPLNGTGTEIPTLSVSSPYDSYLLTGTATATGNYAIVPTGSPQLGTKFKFYYDGVLDITTGSKTFSLFGASITQAQLLKTWDAICFYDGSTWKVELIMNFSETEIISTANLANLSVTTAKINTAAVTNPKIANNTIDLHAKSVALSLTNSEIANNTINGYDKLQAASVTPDRLAILPNNYILGNISGGLHSPSGIPIATIINSSGWSLIGNSGTTAGTNFLGTTDLKDLVFKVNNTESGRLSITNNSTSFGYGSLTAIKTGVQNVAIGQASLGNNLSGDKNIGVSVNSLVALTSGSSNIGIGYNSGANILDGNYNTCIGDYADVNSPSSLNRIALGAGAVATADFQLATPSGLSSVQFPNATVTLKNIAVNGKTQNISAGNTATINAVAGSFRKSASGTTFVLSNNLISSTSIVLLQMATAGITAGYDLAVSTAYGSATIYFQSAGVLTAPNSSCDINFWVIN